MRSKFTETGPIPVTEIMLDTTNYRIGGAEDQAECIELLFTAFGPKMLGIADHIARRGLSIKPIVVQKENGNWIVKDGNRRVAAIQLLNNPALAPAEHKAAFMKMKADYFKLGNIPAAINCSTSTDLEAINDYMQLEHLGQQEGVGLAPWGTREKDNMTLHLGGKSTVGIAKKVLSYLEAHGLNEAKTVKITNIQRLLQDAYVQSQLGIIWDGESFKFTLNEEETRKALTEIVLDFSIREKKVGVIYERADRKEYIDELLGARGFRPSAAPAPAQAAATMPAPAGPSAPDAISPAPAAPAPNGSTSKPAPLPTRAPRDRKHVIERRNSLPVPSTETKMRSILYELGTPIFVHKTPMAAAVLLRVAVELSVNNYINKNGLRKKEELKRNITSVANHMKDAGLLDQKDFEIIEKTSRHEELTSANSLNHYVHSSTFMPKASDINNFYDNVRNFLFRCW